MKLKILSCLLILIMCSCFETNEEKKVLVRNPPVGTIFTKHGEREIYLYIIDSCEYIGKVEIENSDVLTHKGNCKFCLKRNKK